MVDASAGKSSSSSNGSNVNHNSEFIAKSLLAGGIIPLI